MFFSDFDGTLADVFDASVSTKICGNDKFSAHIHMYYAFFIPSMKLNNEYVFQMLTRPLASVRKRSFARKNAHALVHLSTVETED